MAVNIGDVAHAIQLAIAPVFLLTGVAGILNVMAGRLTRIIDRGRQRTEQALPELLQLESVVQVELQSLEHATCECYEVAVETYNELMKVTA